jgi:hypothetical protein
LETTTQIFFHIFVKLCLLVTLSATRYHQKKLSNQSPHMAAGRGMNGIEVANLSSGCATNGSWSAVSDHIYTLLKVRDPSKANFFRTGLFGSSVGLFQTAYNTIVDVQLIYDALILAHQELLAKAIFPTMHCSATLRSHPSPPPQSEYTLDFIPNDGHVPLADDLFPAYHRAPTHALPPPPPLPPPPVPSTFASCAISGEEQHALAGACTSGLCAAVRDHLSTLLIDGGRLDIARNYRPGLIGDSENLFKQVAIDGVNRRTVYKALCMAGSTATAEAILGNSSHKRPTETLSPPTFHPDQHVIQLCVSYNDVLYHTTTGTDSTWDEVVLQCITVAGLDSTANKTIEFYQKDHDRWIRLTDTTFDMWQQNPTLKMKLRIRNSVVAPAPPAPLAATHPPSVTQIPQVLHVDERGPPAPPPADTLPSSVIPQVLPVAPVPYPVAPRGQIHPQQ